MSWRTRTFMGLMVVAVGLSAAMPAAAAARAREAEPAPAAPATPPPSLEEAFKILPTYEFGQSREALTVISDAVRDAFGKPERAALVKRLTALLPTGATADAKRFIFRQLAVVGTAECVPTVARFLLDKDLSDMARFALEQMPDPAVDAALRDALAKSQGKIKIGLINTLGMRRDAKALEAIAPALKDADPQIAGAAAAALGRIGSVDALRALQAARPAVSEEAQPIVSDALLACAERLLAEGKKDQAGSIYQDLYQPTETKHVRIAALRGLVATQGEKAVDLLAEILGGTDTEFQAAAIRFLREVSGPDSAKTVAALLPKSPPASQALLLDDLGARGDAATLPAVLPLTKSADAGVRLAALRAVGKLGGAAVVPMLLGLATGDQAAERDEARRALERLPGADVNPALTDLARKGDAKARLEVIRALGARRVAAAVAVLLANAKDADAAIRLESLKALDAVADDKSAAALADLVVQAKADDERAAAEKALGSVCSRSDDRTACADAILAKLGAADGPAKCTLLRTLGRAGGPKALDAVRAATKDPAADVQDAAIRSLADWTDAAASADLLDLAKSAPKASHQVLALRGYIRLVGAQTGLSASKKLAMYQEALAVAKRPDEKRLVLGGLGDMKDIGALKMVSTLLDDETLQAEACVAAVKIVKALGDAAKDKEEAREALGKVVKTTKDATLRKEAEGLLKQVGAPKVLKAPRPAAEGLGWRLGMQAYSFNRFTFFEAIDKTASLGLKYIEIYPRQTLSKDHPDVKTGHDMTDEQIAVMKQKAASAGVSIVNYGVVALSKDEAASRKVFEFARKVGIETIVSEPPEDAFDTIAKLCDEFGINVALHNHPKPSKYWDPDVVLKALEGRTRRIGACADTGHWMRSGLDPLACLKKLEGRIVSLHFKDLNRMARPEDTKTDRPHDVPWGTGAGNPKALLAEIKRQGLKAVFSIEYEHNWENSVPDIAQCVEFFNATAADLAK